MRVLVAYASRHGSTQGIARRIAERIGRPGIEVTLEEVGRVRDVDGYDAFVVGASAYFFHWAKEATVFVQRHHDVLGGRPTWLFSSGPLGTDLVDEKGQDILATLTPREFPALITMIRPRGERIFFGAYDPDARPVGFLERMTKLMPAARDAFPVGDFRDWPAIEAWADGIAAELVPERETIPSGA